MEDAEPTGFSRRGKAGRPKKFAEPWVCLAKRVYLEEDMFTSLRQLKSRRSFKSDDAAVRYLISRHDYLCLVER